MADLLYIATMSLDGYVEDRDGRFDWTTPDREVHGFINDVLRPVGTYLFGRRMYETMRYWEAPPAAPEELAAEHDDFAHIWRAADKVVYSTTLEAVTCSRTRLERAFIPDAVQALKSSAVRPISVGGSHLAAQAVAAALVDELHLFIVPVMLGAGTPFLAAADRLSLELLHEHRFGRGSVYLRYRMPR